MSLQEFLDSVRVMRSNVRSSDSPVTLDIDIDNDPVYIDNTGAKTAKSNGGGYAWYKSQFPEDQEAISEIVLSSLVQHQDDDMRLQDTLLEILGYDKLDLIIELIQRKYDIVQEYSIENKIAENLERKKEKARQLVREGPKGPEFPHIYSSNTGGSGILSAYGTKYSLPQGTTRDMYEYYEEVVIPAATNKRKLYQGKPVTLNDMDVLCKGTFKRYTSLNPMQSLVYPLAYESNENMLVCAPTGAGKTDVALLTMLNTIKQFSEEAEGVFNIAYDSFKIVYVAPLKALAAEIVEKTSSRLAWLGITVRELTGDMQLTRAEIAATQIIVTTPEKWDVVTRKPTGDNEIFTKLRLMIIDEVHLLHEERGAVIESLVARTLRQVESAQSVIRIVGLSATLPNFKDVAEFLSVPPVGVFFFDQSFRPVPLEQQFIGVRGKAGSRTAMEYTDRVSYDKVIEMLKQGHQIMVFVHSRRDTVKTGRTFAKMAHEHGTDALFDCQKYNSYGVSASKYHEFKRDMGKCKNKDMRELFDSGIGVHHAGMLRSERNLSERLFLSGAIRVLCCTATLAWGVNLPAAVVIIKGTQVYDAKSGGFVDLGISDVIQIFGRAGRPQFEKYGVGIIVTSSDRLSHYLALITQQLPIESKLQPKIVDSVNAEIARGTITTVDEAVQWLGYTYLYVRMKRNPLGYGLEWDDVRDDPSLVNHRRKLIISAAARLHQLQMIVYDSETASFTAKDLGRVASEFYLLSTSVEVFNHMMSPVATEADVLSMISMSGEFDGVKSRQEEQKELELMVGNIPCQLAKGPNQSEGKVNILLQAFISREVARLKEASLISDTQYIAQNSIRIARALFLISVHRRWGRLARILLILCKSIDRRLWEFQHPFIQFEQCVIQGRTRGEFQLPENVIRLLESKPMSMEETKELSSAELGDLVHNSRMGPKLYEMADRLPLLSVEVEVQPITSRVLRVKAEITALFRWDAKIHGNSLMFWLWVEDDSERSEIIHVEKLVVTPQRLYDSDTGIISEFSIPLHTRDMPDQLILRTDSDSWLGSENITMISFKHLIRPENEPIETRLLRLRPLTISESSLNEEAPKVARVYLERDKILHFNPMQTMVYHSLFHNSFNALLGSPTGSGKTVACELAMWEALFKRAPGSKVVYIAPMKALVRERVDDWTRKLRGVSKIVELTGDTNPEASEINRADIIVTTPEKFDGISRQWQSRKFVTQVSLVIMDEIHLLASDRGPILEMIVSRMNYLNQQQQISNLGNKKEVVGQLSRKVRLMGMSTAVANAGDLASWLKIDDSRGLFNFPSSVRPVPLQMYIEGFPEGSGGFGGLMASMNRPAFLAIKKHSPERPVLVFVASRRQTRLTAQDFIKQLAMENNPRRFLHNVSEVELESYVDQIEDEALKVSVQFGIVIHNAGLSESDRRLSHKLFLENKTQVLVATSTLAWGVNLPAYLVIIKGTQFFDSKLDGYKDMDLTDVLQMMGRAGRPKFDTQGVAIVYTRESTKQYYKYFINSGFPVESALHKVLEDHVGAEIASGVITSRRSILKFLEWTFLYRRIFSNPSYYDIGSNDTEADNIAIATPQAQWLSKLIDRVVNNLTESFCIVGNGSSDQLVPTKFLKIASYYYMSHLTIRKYVTRLYGLTPAVAPKTANPISVVDVIELLALATEYDDLAIRHNEDLVNTELSRLVGYDPNSAIDNNGSKREIASIRMVDPHVKAFVLIQTYMHKIDLPSTDYQQDLRTVLDQAQRILQAMLDICCEVGCNIWVAECILNTIRGIRLGCWPEASTKVTREGNRNDTSVPKRRGPVPTINNKSHQIEFVKGSCVSFKPRIQRIQQETWVVLKYSSSDETINGMQRIRSTPNSIPVGSQSDHIKVASDLFFLEASSGTNWV